MKDQFFQWWEVCCYVWKKFCMITCTICRHGMLYHACMTKQASMATLPDKKKKKKKKRPCYADWKIQHQTSISQHHWGPIEGPLETPQTITAFSYWGFKEQETPLCWEMPVSRKADVITSERSEWSAKSEWSSHICVASTTFNHL